MVAADGVEDAPTTDTSSSTDESLLDFFDRQIQDETTLSGFLLATAVATGCVVGARGRHGVGIQADPHGHVLEDAACPALAVRHRLTSGEESWVQVPDGSGANAALVAEQLAVVVRTLTRRHSEKGVAPSVAALLIDPHLDEVGRALLLRRLGLNTSTKIRVLAVAGPAHGREVLVASLAGTSPQVRTGRCGRLTVAILETRPECRDLDLDVPIGVQIGYSRTRTVSDLAVAWTEACLALRFTQPSTRDRGPYWVEESFVLGAESVGSYQVLAEYLPVSALAEVEDVRLLDQLVAEHGHHLLEILDTVAATVSVREAARRLNMHHNSVAFRVARVERALGTSLAAPYGKARLFQALTLRRLKETARLF